MSEYDTGKFRRVIHDEIGAALDNAAMKLEAIRVNTLMADLAEVSRRVQVYSDAIESISLLMQQAYQICLEAIELRGDDQVLAEIALLMERVANVTRTLRNG